MGTAVTVSPGTGDTATATSSAFTPDAAGEWCFAVDSGGGAYERAADTTTDECFSVVAVLATAPAESSITLGTADADVATVNGTAGGGVPTGTVTFSVCGPTTGDDPCTSGGDPVGTPVTLKPGTGDTATATSSAFTADAVGDWCFAAQYSGGGAYEPAADTTTDGCFDVVAVSPAFTSAGSAAVTVGKAITFSVTTTGSPTPAITGSSLPKWLTLTDNGNGTATLRGTMAAHVGKHTFTLTATNSAAAVDQTFTLTVKKARR